MPIQVQIPDEFFEGEQRAKLRELLESADEEQFEASIGRICLAGLYEYKDMLLGSGMPTRADEIRQHRLFHLIKKYFVGRLPSEPEVSRMFQLTQSRSKSLIRYVMTRFRYELEDEIKETLIQQLQQAQFDEDQEEYRLVIRSDNVLEELNLLISLRAPTFDQIRKVPNRSRTYAISEDSYNTLADHFEIPHLEHE